MNTQDTSIEYLWYWYLIPAVPVLNTRGTGMEYPRYWYRIPVVFSRGIELFHGYRIPVVPVPREYPWYWYGIPAVLVWNTRGTGIEYGTIEKRD